ncbi:MAG TPA: amidohydrolase family protein [Acholeplasmataceae bacterium]|nr:amidohydrolase family protein [Acholeplasmataceae bacterium]
MLLWLSIKDFTLDAYIIKIISGFYPNDKRLYEVYSLASQKGVPVFIHSGIKALEWQRMVFNNPIIIDDIATSFPDLRIIIMHAGYPWTKEAFTVARLNKNVFLDITFLDVIDYTFEEGILEYIVKKASKILGASKIIWGSEGKYLKLNMYMDEGIVRIKKNLEEIITYKFLSSKEKEMVLFDNFNNLFEDNFSI